jgi:tRNA threonylcarbamoyl adenosine modification protein (Sua5/YciO/YrdC/YwlC family)
MSGFKYNNLSEQDIRLLKTGAVGVLPSDTIYGIVTQIKNKDSVERLYALKGRENKPGTIIALNIQQLIDLGVNPEYLEKANAFWPNPISIIIPVDDSLSYAHLGVNSLAFRVVADPEIAKLLDITGPLLTSSANEPGKPVANTIKEAREYFDNKVDFYIDGGDLSGATASAVIIVGDNGIKVLRDSPILQKLQK